MILKPHNNKKYLLGLVRTNFGKLITRSGLIILLLSFQQTTYAQTVNAETNSDMYSNFLIVALILLVASVFIGLEILGDPKYESLSNKQLNPSVSIQSPEFELDKSITGKLRIIFYVAGLLLLMNAVLILLMF